MAIPDGLLSQVAVEENSRTPCARRADGEIRPVVEPTMSSNGDDIQQKPAAPVVVEAFYRYGYKGRPMLAIRAPFAMGADGAEIIGRVIDAGGRHHVVVGIARQISGPIHPGEPFGVELRANDALEESSA